MEIKVFRAANLQAALEEIRDQLGPNASVLRTRQCRDGWMGWLGRSYVEVTASTGGDKGDEATGPLRESVEPGQRTLILPTDHASRYQRPPIDSRPGDMPARIRIAPTRDTPISAPAHHAAFDEQNDYRKLLGALGVIPGVADRWLEATAAFLANFESAGPQLFAEQLSRSVSRELRLSGPIRLNPGERRIVALIGPTGVGKTTTVAKLAAGFRMQQNRRVGLLTIDTFRIAAVQQLQAYAQLMDLPMSVVESADQMRSAIERLGDVDLILIDTAGRSPKGDVHVAALADLLRTAQPDETHLVISATSTSAVVQSVIDGFSVASPTATILTKLDETPYTAGVLSAIMASGRFVGLPVSYVTNGQQVPDDISIATEGKLIEHLLPEPTAMAQFEAA